MLLDIKSYPFKSVFIVLAGFRPFFFLYGLLQVYLVHIGVLFSGLMGIFKASVCIISRDDIAIPIFNACLAA